MASRCSWLSPRRLSCVVRFSRIQPLWDRVQFSSLTEEVAATALLASPGTPGKKAFVEEAPLQVQVYPRNEDPGFRFGEL